MFPKAALFDKKYSKKKQNSNIVKYIFFLKTIFFLNIFLNIIYSCDAKLNFQHHYSSLQCHITSFLKNVFIL